MPQNLLFVENEANGTTVLTLDVDDPELVTLGEVDDEGNVTLTIGKPELTDKEKEAQEALEEEVIVLIIDEEGNEVLPKPVEEQVVEEEVESEYEAYTVEELKDMLAERGLPVSGVKAELIARLEEDDAA